MGSFFCILLSKDELSLIFRGVTIKFLQKSTKRVGMQRQLGSVEVMWASEENSFSAARCTLHFQNGLRRRVGSLGECRLPSDDTTGAIHKVELPTGGNSPQGREPCSGCGCNWVQ